LNEELYLTDLFTYIGLRSWIGAILDHKCTGKG